MQYLKKVVTLELDVDACVGCGMCVMACPHAVFNIRQGKAFIGERDDCMECGACARNCPVDAISVDFGVGCATGLLNAALGRTSGDCCSAPQHED